MPITDVRIERYETSPGAGARSAAAETARRPALRLLMADDAGRLGQGEASPLPGFSRETFPEAHSALARITPERLREVDVFSALDTARALRDELALPSSALFALESVLLDREGRRRGLPVHRLLGAKRRPTGTTESAHGAAPRVPLNTLLHAATPGQLFVGIRAALERGIDTIKWKLGRAPFEDDFGAECDLLAKARREFGPAFRLRLDANGAWTTEQALANLHRLAALAPEYVEEPSAPGGWDRLAASPVPLAADESLLDPARHDALLANPAVAVLIIKPMALGGFAAGLDLAARAREGGKDVAVTHLFDGPLALAAAAELALALRPEGNLRACGLDRHAGLDAWPATVIPQLAGDAVVAGTWDGLGIEPW